MTGLPPPPDDNDRAPQPWRTRGAHVRPVRLTRLASAPVEAPFVGREQLLQHVHELADVAREGHGIVVALSGEAGIGKSRLLHEVARRGSGFGFQVDWIREAPQVAGVLNGVAEGGPASPGLHRGEAPLPFPLLKWSRKPRLIVVDDALREECVPVLTALTTAGIARLPVLVLLGLSPDLHRPTIDARRALAALARQRILAQVPMPPLGEAELSELATHVLGGRPDPRLQGTISSLTEGNPLLAESLMADLLDRGQVSRSNGSCGLLGEIPATYTPPAIGTLLGHMLESIDAEIVQSLASAAALGSGFRCAALERATGQPAEQLLEHLEAGLAFGILRETTEPPDDFQFVHELVRRALQGSLSQVRARRLRRALSTAHDGQQSDHLSSGPDPSSATGARRQDEGAEALAATLRLLERAERLCSWEEAIRQCRTALDLTRHQQSGDVADEIHLLERLSALYFGRVQAFAAGSCLREALQLCEQTDEPLHRVVLTARLAAMGPSWCSVEAAEALFAQVVRAAPDSSVFDRAALFDSHLELGLAHQRYGSLTAALPSVQAACDLVDPADRARHSLGKYALGALLVTMGDVERASVLLRTAITSLDFGMAEEWSRDDLVHWRDPRRTRCMALAELARALDLLGRTDEAERYAEAARAEEVRFGILGGRSHRAKAQVQLSRGEPEAALQQLLTTSDEATPGSLGVRRAGDLVLVSASHLALGNTNLALETALEGVSICSRMGAGEFLAGLQVARARALIACGRLDEAREATTAAHRAIDTLGTGVFLKEAQAVAREVTRAARPSGPERDTSERGAEDVAAWPGTDAAVAAVTAPATPSPVVHAALEYVRGRSLTVREREILQLMAAGKTNRQIAVEIEVSDKTVKRHVSNIFNKLAASTRAMAVRQAHEARILSANSEPREVHAP